MTDLPDATTALAVSMYILVLPEPVIPCNKTEPGDISRIVVMAADCALLNTKFVRFLERGFRLSCRAWRVLVRPRGSIVCNTVARGVV